MTAAEERTAEGTPGFWRGRASVRLVAAVFGLSFVSVTLLSWSRLRVEERILTEQVDAIGTSMVETLALVCPDAMLAQGTELEDYVNVFTRQRGVPVAFVLVRRADGKQLAPVPDGPVLPVPDGVRVYEMPVLVQPEGRVLGSVTVGLYLEPWRRTLRDRTFSQFLQNVAVFGVIAIVLTLLLRRVVSVPLARLDRMARRIGAGDLEQAVSLPSVDEFGRLACTLEQMRKSLRASRESLEVQNAQLLEVDRLKDEFIANMSHEIRTPLHSILGSAELIDDLDGAQRDECLDALRRNAKHLLYLVNQVLDFSKLQTGNLCLERESVRLQPLFEDAVACMRPTASDKGLAIRLVLAPGAPESLHTDALRVRQILMNVIGNAIKFTDQGGIDVTVTGEAAGSAVIDVTDSGPGMTEEQQQRLFIRFSQGDTSLTRRAGGTGLGLVISRELARALGGDVTVHSTSGVGTSVRIRLADVPADAESRESAAATVAGASRRRSEPLLAGKPAVPEPVHGRVLLVDDAVDNRKLLSVVLKKAGLDVTTAENGELACSAIESSGAAGQPFDLVLMDVQMPVLDGIAAVQRLRAGGCGLPMVALTAHATDQDRDRCRAAGFDDYASKPISRAQLVELVRRYVQR